ncbi:MAG: hypothetical protein M1828_005872 [Chrysothrix sp. TS-e1954]|nr:MAG: hypothetical protein M1828_005872 [Chrysothrix sp. TS-e1954]
MASMSEIIDASEGSSTEAPFSALRNSRALQLADLLVALKQQASNTRYGRRRSMERSPCPTRDLLSFGAGLRTKFRFRNLCAKAQTPDVKIDAPSVLSGMNSGESEEIARGTEIGTQDDAATATQEDNVPTTSDRSCAVFTNRSASQLDIQ